MNTDDVWYLQEGKARQFQEWHAINTCVGSNLDSQGIDQSESSQKSYVDERVPADTGSSHH